MIKKILLLGIVLSFCTSILYADTNEQLRMLGKYLMENDSTYASKKTPDSFDGFRQFKFYTPITDYIDCKYQLIYEKKTNYSMYEITLPDDEKQFLGSEIIKVLIEQYNNKIFRITLFLKSDVGPVLDNLFRSNFSGLGIGNPDKELVPKQNFKDYWNSAQTTFFEKKFRGLSTSFAYGEIDVKDTSPFSAYYLKIFAPRYKNTIDRKLNNEHYDVYLSDFGTEYYPQKNDIKKSYIIPLFEFNNIFYVRVLFGDVVDNLIFDTGADQLIISKNLYNKLKANDLVIPDENSMKMQTATGDTIDLKRVILKYIQLNDLCVNNVVAYVNTSDDISLLGQSFLKRFGKITIDHKLNLLTITK